VLLFSGATLYVGWC